jgi:hypothetical protein
MSVCVRLGSIGEKLYGCAWCACVLKRGRRVGVYVLMHSELQVNEMLWRWFLLSCLFVCLDTGMYVLSVVRGLLIGSHLS